jgi:RNA polymerase sigma-70 factor (ECF subfamily)
MPPLANTSIHRPIDCPWRAGNKLRLVAGFANVESMYINVRNSSAESRVFRFECPLRRTSQGYRNQTEKSSFPFIRQLIRPFIMSIPEIVQKNRSREEDAEAVRRIVAGEDSLYDSLVMKYANRMFQISFGLLGNREDAEEVVQDAFVRAYRGLRSFRGDASFETWIHRIVVNLSRNKYQWNKRRGFHVNVSMTLEDQDAEGTASGEEMNIPDSTMDPNRLIEGKEFERSVAKGIEKMPEKLKEVMILRHVHEMPYEKIAETLECKVGTVKSRLARGRDVLRRFVGL